MPEVSRLGRFSVLHFSNAIRCACGGAPTRRLTRLMPMPLDTMVYPAQRAFAADPGMAEQLEKEGVGRYAQYAELPAVRMAGKLQIRLCAASKIVRHRVMRQKHARTGLAPGEDGFRAGMAVPALVYAAQTQALHQYAFVYQQPHMPAHQLRKAGDFAVVVAHAGVYAQPGAQQGQGANNRSRLSASSAKSPPIQIISAPSASTRAKSASNAASEKRGEACISLKKANFRPSSAAQGTA